MEIGSKCEICYSQHLAIFRTIATEPSLEWLTQATPKSCMVHLKQRADFEIGPPNFRLWPDDAPLGLPKIEPIHMHGSFHSNQFLEIVLHLLCQKLFIDEGVLESHRCGRMAKFTRMPNIDGGAVRQGGVWKQIS
jgi:hypothetical protein